MTPPRAVLHVINTGGPGGAETVCANIARNLDRSRFRSLAIVPDRGWIFRELTASGIETFVIPDASLGRVPGYLLRMLRLATRESVCLIHAHLFGPTVMASLVGKLASVPVVCTLHGEGDLHPRERARRLKFSIVNHGASRVVFVSEALRDHFLSLRLLRPELASVIPNGIDVARYRTPRDPAIRRELGADDGDFLVGAVGNLRPAKNYEVLLNAAAILKARRPGYRFAILGALDSEYGRDMVALSKTLGVSDVVRFAGYRDDLERVLPSLDTYALTSRSEGFSISTIEALAAGVPVVATRCGGPERILQDGVTGLLVENGSAEAVADAIERLTLDQAVKTRMGKAGLAAVSEQYTLHAQVQRYERLYLDCLPPSTRVVSLESPQRESD